VEDRARSYFGGECANANASDAGDKKEEVKEFAMLKKITLRNFKSFRDSTFELGPLTLMVGANASGKSNFVDALRFLQGCARGLTLNEIFSGKWEGGQQVWLPIRGGEQELLNLFTKEKNFEIEVNWNLPFDNSSAYDGFYKIGFGDLDNTSIQTTEHFNVDDHKLTGKSLVAKNIAAAATLGLLNTDSEQQKLRKWIGILRTWLKDFHFLNLTPSLMRDYVSKSQSEIGIHGENLSAVLFRLASNPDQRRTVLDWVQELCPQ
jgi:predicted ATPase